MNNKIEGHSAVQDAHSKAILSTDANRLQTHRALKEMKRAEHKRMVDLEYEVKEIKQLLLQLLNKTGNL